MLTVEQIQTMMDMQDSLNQKIAPDWKTRGWDWGLAIVDEAMELHGHLGWKWWKDSASYKKGITQDNKKQAQLEVVDIWHFMLSMAIVQDWTAEEVSRLMAKPEKHPHIYSAISALMDDALDSIVSPDSFAVLLTFTELPAQELYEVYVGKYALNKFRYDNGYAEGTYLKQWLVPEVSALYHEDNWFLELILEDFKTHSIEVTAEKVTCSLRNYYNLVLGGK